jgi:hypothetical protein
MGLPSGLLKDTSPARAIIEITSAVAALNIEILLVVISSFLVYGLLTVARMLFMFSFNISSA